MKHHAKLQALKMNVGQKSAPKLSIDKIKGTLEVRNMEDTHLMKCYE